MQHASTADLLHPAFGGITPRRALRERAVAGGGGALRHQRQDGAGHLEPRDVDRRDGAALDRPGPPSATYCRFCAASFCAIYAQAMGCIYIPPASLPAVHAHVFCRQPATRVHPPLDCRRWRTSLRPDAPASPQAATSLMPPSSATCGSNHRATIHRSKPLPSRQRPLRRRAAERWRCFGGGLGGPRALETRAPGGRPPRLAAASPARPAPRRAQPA